MSAHPARSIRQFEKSARGFTLVEMLISIGVFSLVILVTVATQIYATRVYTLTATKLNAMTNARIALNDIRDRIRQGQIVNVGNYIWTGHNLAGTNFALISDGNYQEGNALMIYPSATNTTSFTVMYLQPGKGTNFALNPVSSTNCLIVETFTNGVLMQSNAVANFITNQFAFFAMDCKGNILTNNINNRVIQVQLYFSQWEFPIAYAGTNAYNAYEYYRLQTRITRRLVD